MSDFVEAVKKPVTLCAYCPKLCRFTCPVSEAERTETLTPTAKMTLLYLASEGQAALDDDDAARALEACTGCDACREYCAHDNPVSETLFFARAESGTPRSQAIAQSFADTGDSKGRDATAALATVPTTDKAALAYFPGCMRLFKEPARMGADLQVLSRAAGTEVKACALPAQKHCCGYALYAEGAYAAWEAHVTELAEALSGYDTIVTPDPGCAYVLSDVVKARGLDVKLPAVTTLVEYCADNTGPFAGVARDRAADGRRVVYHDACYLGRKRGVYEPPRALLETALGAPPAGFTQCKADAMCSGSGGLYPMSSPEHAKAAARRVLDHDGDLGDAVVVTSCPSARRGFERAGATALDITDVLGGEEGNDG